ncbi:MAG: ABC transporter ATP-binding protein [Eisenbergiella sp.]|uniref:ABC transporter ATP-binding protein n=1 Tax=unclassified Eisenbergiella TaxID=2652273 RepID=UPI000E4AC156|nr:ABC transporter ATP-binding protein [Eisenbergiella sp. OF01-20]MBS5536185.1 ABC transporter ATP-binding protein [Lachnospiraceae bacterium]RHP91276.1 ABC transporter ATP-binding protein [Eisenbergiella sp. OF01-20]
MKKILKKMNVLLDGKQKVKMGGIVVLMIIGAILEACSIGLVIPVITTLLDPEAVKGEGYLGNVYRFLGLESTSQFTIVMLVAIIAAFVLKNIFLYFQNVVQLRFVYTNQFSTSRRMMINFMERPYEYYLNADTSVIQRSITSDVNNMYGLILSSLQLVSEMIMFVVLVIVLMTQDPLMIFTIALLLVAVLLIIKCILKPIMIKAGEDNQEYYSGLYKWIDQSVMGIKEIKIANKENYFINEYSKCGAGYVDAVQKYNIYNATPRLLIETVCIAGLVLYLIIQIASGKEVTAMITQIGVFAVAAMRLLPSANRINNYLTSISYFEPFFMGVSDNLQEEINDRSVNYSAQAYEARKEICKLPVREKIELKGIVYKYPNTEVLIFDHADMVIPVGCSVGVVGTSGAGKTTIIDVLLGLLTIQEGRILADGVEVREHYEEWLKNIGYIPQTIFMIDASIRKNVAFGVPDEEIDDNKVWEALKEAQLDEFVRGLPEGLDTGIGERGIRLSGGQRQRIGIARALFEDPEVLVLDEATSALDNETEAAIMDSINRLHGRKTLVIIAHRLQTIEKCDMVYRVEKGRIAKER